MTEDEAKQWIEARFGDGGCVAMARLAEIVVAESHNQNLVAPSTLAAMWNRHIVDSAQLLSFAPVDGVWLDIGSGAGFPGLVVAALSKQPVWLIEPRRKRADFLQHAAEALGLSASVTVVCAHARAATVEASVISARAVAPLGDLFTWAEGCATSTTRWILPKGRTAREELQVARQAWHGAFHVEHSITDDESLIVLASKVARR